SCESQRLLVAAFVVEALQEPDQGIDLLRQHVAIERSAIGQGGEQAERPLDLPGDRGGVFDEVAELDRRALGLGAQLLRECGRKSVPLAFVFSPRRRQESAWARADVENVAA